MSFEKHSGFRKFFEEAFSFLTSLICSDALFANFVCLFTAHGNIRINNNRAFPMQVFERSVGGVCQPRVPGLIASPHQT